MAKAEFIMQGINKDINHMKGISSLLKHDNIEEITIATAFLKSNGLEAIESLILENVDKVKMYVGIRNGITTKQGIEKAISLGINIKVVDTGTQHFIFHPKLYVVNCGDYVYAIIGSANLTTGGLVSNIETSTMLKLDMNIKADKEYYEQLISCFEKLTTDYTENVMLISNIEDVNELFIRGLLSDEEATLTYKGVNTDKSGEARVTPIMKLETETISTKSKKKKYVAVDRVKEVAVYGDVDISGMSLVELWSSKELTERDLNIPTGTNTNITGSMTLKKGEYSHIDQRHYFRDEVFNQVTWRKLNKKRPHLEYADVSIKFVIEDIDYGEYILRLKHDIRTNTASYRQSNAMTHLMWKEAKDIIRNSNLLGKKMKLYKDKDSSRFVIIID